MIRIFRGLLAPLALLTTLLAGPAAAGVSVRVEGRPASEPIQVFVRVTDETSGVPITDLVFTDFDVSIDGVAEVLTGDQFTQPQEADPNQQVSVVFVMDYTSSVTTNFLAEMQNAVIDFIEAMEPGDMAAIIKFNDTSGEQVIQPFTEIDDGANDQLLIDAVASTFTGDGSNILDAVNLGVQQFVDAGATLPAGPKAVILVSDGRDSHSDANQGAVVDAANDISIPLFTIGIGNPQTRGLEILTGLADDTGGEYVDATDGGDIGAAYESVRLLLTGEYLITIPNSITDCGPHEATVAVEGQTEIVTVPFTRRVCNTTPTAFTFTAQTNVAPGAVVTSNTATVAGIEAPAHISVIQGGYSIGCTGTFTTDPGTIADGQTVCLQQTAASAASTSKTTTLTVGGLAVTFTTTTAAAPGGGGGGGGGGGAAGLFEILLGLGLLLARRRLA